MNDCWTHKKKPNSRNNLYRFINQIIADTSKELKKEKKSVGVSAVAAAPAPNVKSDLEKDVKELEASGKLVERKTSRLSPTTPPVADGRIIPTTTSTANDQDLKSPVKETWN
jgi:hypothetical protein